MARLRGLDRLRGLRRTLVGLRKTYLRRVWGVDLDPTCEISLSARFDLTNPRGVHVGPWSYIAFDARLLSHDMTRGLYLHTRVGANCFIGGRSLILPGVEIGDGCVIGAGSVVTRSIPPGCVAAGNPARVLREGIRVGRYGRFLDADEAERRFHAELSAEAGREAG